MPIFDFSLCVPKKKAETHKDNYWDETVAANIRGVVWIDNKANYYISIGDGFVYPIDKKCYSCEGKYTLYRQGEYDKCRVTYIRHHEYAVERNNDYWLPFGVGCVVFGDLIHNTHTKLHRFIIKRCLVDYENKESHEALQFYRRHLKEINDIIRKRRYEH